MAYGRCVRTALTNHPSQLHILTMILVLFCKHGFTEINCLHSLYLVHSDDDDDDEGGPFVIVMRMIGVMNVAPWECLPIAILMQTPLQLLPRATSPSTIFSTQKFSFSPAGEISQEGGLRVSCWKNVMAGLITLQQPS